MFKLKYCANVQDTFKQEMTKIQRNKIIAIYYVLDRNVLSNK